MKKFLSTLLIMSMSVFILAGCSQDADPVTEDPMVDETPVVEEEPKVEQPMEEDKVIEEDKDMKVDKAMGDDIVDIASSDENLSILVAALKKANLVDTLKGEGPFTVFAPTNEAFEKLLKELDITSEELLAHPDLEKVLTYHVVSGEVKSTDLEDKMEADTVNGQKLKVDLTDGVMVNDAKVTKADIEAKNGVIHLIDKVLVPDDFKL